MAFLYESQNSLLSYINSTFLIQNFNLTVDQVGYLFSGGSLVSLLLLYLAPRYIHEYGKQKVLATIALLTALCVFLVSGIPFPYAAFMFILFLGGNQIIWYITDLKIEDETSTKNTGKIRGILFTLLNGAWLIFPALAFRLLSSGTPISNFYIWTGIALICISLLTYLQKETIAPIHKPTPTSLSVEHILLFFKNKERKMLFYIHFFLKVFYAVMIIYTPIYLRDVIGIPWSQIDGIFFIMLLPFILIEYPIGYLEDKKIKEHVFLRIGFFILFVSLIVFMMISTSNWIIWALVLFMTRVGAAIIEVSTESAFFKIIHHKEIEFVSVFRSATPLSYIITPVFVSILISTSGGHISYAYLIPIILSCVGFYLSHILSKNSTS